MSLENFSEDGSHYQIYTAWYNAFQLPNAEKVQQRAREIPMAATGERAVNNSHRTWGTGRFVTMTIGTLYSPISLEQHQGWGLLASTHIPFRLPLQPYYNYFGSYARWDSKNNLTSFIFSGYHPSRISIYWSQCCELIKTLIPDYFPSCFPFQQRKPVKWFIKLERVLHLSERGRWWGICQGGGETLCMLAACGSCG